MTLLASCRYFSMTLWIISVQNFYNISLKFFNNGLIVRGDHFSRQLSRWNWYQRVRRWTSSPGIIGYGTPIRTTLRLFRNSADRYETIHAKNCYTVDVRGKKKNSNYEYCSPIGVYVTRIRELQLYDLVVRLWHGDIRQFSSYAVICSPHFRCDDTIRWMVNQLFASTSFWSDTRIHSYFLWQCIWSKVVYLLYENLFCEQRGREGVVYLSSSNVDLLHVIFCPRYSPALREICIPIFNMWHFPKKAT